MFVALEWQSRAPGPALLLGGRYSEKSTLTGKVLSRATPLTV